MNLEIERRGGGKVEWYWHDAANRKVLVVFKDVTGELYRHDNSVMVM